MRRPNANLHILHCFRSPVGGLFRHVYDLAKAQAAAGHRLAITCDSETGDALTDKRLTELQKICALGIFRFPINRYPHYSDLKAIRKVRQIAHQVGATIIHGHGAKGGLLARFAKPVWTSPGSPVRIFYTPHGGALHYEPGSLKGSLFLSVEKKLQTLTDGLIFECDFSYRTYQEKIGPPKCATRVVHNGLNPEEFKPLSPISEATDFVFVGELRYLKGVDVFIDALSALNRQCPVTATIVGSGPDENSFRALVKTRELTSRITFHPVCPINQALRFGRCLVVPSRREAFPYVVLEAIAAKRPLIIANVGGIPEIVGTESPLLFPPENVGCLANKMKSFICGPEKFETTLNYLHADIKKDLNIKTMHDNIYNFYTNNL